MNRIGNWYKLPKCTKGSKISLYIQQVESQYLLSLLFYFFTGFFKHIDVATRSKECATRRAHFLPLRGRKIYHFWSYNKTFNSNLFGGKDSNASLLAPSIYDWSLFLFSHLVHEFVESVTEENKKKSRETHSLAKKCARKSKEIFSSYLYILNGLMAKLPRHRLANLDRDPLVDPAVHAQHVGGRRPRAERHQRQTRHKTHHDQHSKNCEKDQQATIVHFKNSKFSNVTRYLRQCCQNGIKPGNTKVLSDGRSRLHWR